jgi:hypothetical protein
MPYKLIVPTSKANAKLSRPPIMVPLPYSSAWYNPGHAHSSTNSATKQFMEPLYSIENTQEFNMDMQYQDLTADIPPVRIGDFYYKDRIDKYMTDSNKYPLPRPINPPTTNDNNYNGGVSGNNKYTPLDYDEGVTSIDPNAEVLMPSAREGGYFMQPTYYNAVDSQGRPRSVPYDWKIEGFDLPTTNTVASPPAWDSHNAQKELNSKKTSFLDIIGIGDKTTKPKLTPQQQQDQNINKKSILTDIEPNVFQRQNMMYPINNNLGQSWVTEKPIIVFNPADQSNNPYGNTVLYNSYDPQLIRDDLPKYAQAEMPVRTPYSDRYGTWNKEAAGSVDWTNVYDYRFNSYGAGTRAYENINTGNIEYYVADIDAYRKPNFITKSKVDHIYFKTPLGEEWPRYERNISLQDMRNEAESRFINDTTFFRENLSASQSAKANARSIQLTLGPLQQGGSNMQHSTYRI